MKTRKTYIWLMMAAITLVAAMSTAYADEDKNYPGTDGASPAHSAQPSSHAVARKAMRSADRTLSRGVRKAIAKGGGVDLTHLGVVARSGKVTLVGSVPENDQIALAAQRAQSVAGVTDVANRLSIDMPGGH